MRNARNRRRSAQGAKLKGQVDTPVSDQFELFFRKMLSYSSLHQEILYEDDGRSNQREKKNYILEEVAILLITSYH